MNEMIVSHCVAFYQTCWKHRNKICKDRDKQMQRVIEWMMNIEKHVEDYEVKLFVRRNGINVERCKTKTAIQWTCNAKEMMKKVSKVPKNDIWRFFETNYKMC